MNQVSSWPNIYGLFFQYAKQSGHFNLGIAAMFAFGHCFLYQLYAFNSVVLVVLSFLPAD